MSESATGGAADRPPQPTSGRKSTSTHVRSEQENRAVPVWTSNKRTVQVPSRFLRALGIEMPACRSELASDVLILAINWLNSDTRIDKDILAEANKDKGFKPSRAIVDRLPDFIIDANNIMIFRALLQLKQLKTRSRIINISKQDSGSDQEAESLQELYIGLCALLAFKINITQSREELLEKFSSTSEELNRVQDDIQLLQSSDGPTSSISPIVETFLQVDASVDTEGKQSSGLINLEIDDQFSGQGSVRIRPGKPLLKSNSLMSMNNNKEKESNPSSSMGQSNANNQRNNSNSNN
ncbi:uncharacterized protein LOC142342142 [Convolutriloba macropyga]|uniref:uncharacterized protein LOC142342142 n=1 Tax=Convolutriloba macropyga TaxID=536237 RepID=UPI003F528911